VETIDRAGATLSDAAGNVISQGVGVHQTALYDMLLAGILFAFLWWFIRSPRREGVTTLAFGLSYGAIRLLEDSVRIDKRFGPFTGSQWTALTVAILASGLLIYWAVSKRPGPTTPGRGASIPNAEAPVTS
jgi:prolipoprotein diacylglyceryltransferase